MDPNMTRLGDIAGKTDVAPASPSPRARSWGVGGRLARALVTFVLVATTLSTLGRWALDHRWLDRTMEREFRTIETVLLPSLSANVWTSNLEQIEINLQTMLAYGTVEYVGLDTVDGHFDRGALSSEYSRTRDFSLTHGLDGKVVSLGTVTVVLGEDRLRTVVLWRALTWVVSGLSGAAVMAVLVFLWVRGRILRPLRAITDRGRAIAAVTEPVMATADRSLTSGGNELLDLSDVIDALAAAPGLARAEGEGRAHARIRDLERDLEAEREENAVRRATETRLGATVETLARTNQDLERFVDAASLDLLEPTRMIASFLSLMEQRHGPALVAEAREFLTHALDGASRLDHLIQGLRNYALIPGDGEITDEVDLNVVLSRVVGGLEDAIARTGAEIVIDPLPTVHANGERMTLLFRELLENVLRYPRPGQIPRARVSQERTEAGHVIRVADRGRGVPPEDRDRVFGLFEGGARGAGPGGDGIGLALCRRIVDRHGGRIWVDGDPGQGAVFHVLLVDPSPDGETPTSSN
jgi:signal transduction histidine kinase